MRYKLSSCKQILVLIFGLTGYLGYFPTTAQTATLDDLYQQIIDKDQLLWTTEISHFQMWEQGYHGSASFNYFESNPSITRFNNVLRASPKDGWEARLGYNYTFPDRYERLTENNAIVYSFLFHLIALSFVLLLAFAAMLMNLKFTRNFCADSVISKNRR